MTGVRGNCIDMAGQVIGRLHVTKDWRRGTKKLPGLHWFCTCTCGKSVWVRSVLLRRVNGTRSCGCLAVEAAAKTAREFGVRAPLKLAPGMAASNSLYSSFLRQAKGRNQTCGITRDRFYELISQSCFYCGDAPQRLCVKKTFNGPCVRNGIDRVDNSIGYEEGNVVACCTICNYMKRNMTLTDFVNRCYTIACRHSA